MIDERDEETFANSSETFTWRKREREERGKRERERELGRIHRESIEMLPLV
jgi:hypothetical protein